MCPVTFLSSKKYEIEDWFCLYFLLLIVNHLHVLSNEIFTKRLHWTLKNTKPGRSASGLCYRPIAICVGIWLYYTFILYLPPKTCNHLFNANKWLIVWLTVSGGSYCWCVWCTFTIIIKHQIRNKNHLLI